MFVMNKMKIKPIFWPLLLILLIGLIPTMPNVSNVYRESINAVSKYIEVSEENISLISARSTHLLIFDFVNIKLKANTDNGSQVLQAELLKFFFQKEYVIKSYSTTE